MHFCCCATNVSYCNTPLKSYMCQEAGTVSKGLSLSSFSLTNAMLFVMADPVITFTKNCLELHGSQPIVLRFGEII